MKATTKDINVLRLAILPAFILSAIVGAIATLSINISDAVTADASLRDRERVVVERAMEERELADNRGNYIP